MLRDIYADIYLATPLILFVDQKSTSASNKRYKFSPELDGIHKYKLLTGLPSHFPNFLPLASADIHTQLWKSFQYMYEALHKVTIISSKIDSFLLLFFLSHFHSVFSLLDVSSWCVLIFSLYVFIVL